MKQLVILLLFSALVLGIEWPMMDLDKDVHGTSCSSTFMLTSLSAHELFCSRWRGPVDEGDKRKDEEDPIRNLDPHPEEEG